MSAISTRDSHTAILFFSHRPEREWQNKWYVDRDYAKNRQVAEAFYRHSLTAVEESGLPVLEVNGNRQRGDQFGTRLANAFADAFAQGYDRVIAVGSDCPRLHEVDWDAVVDRLERGTPVLGPTPDRAGTYLIGMTRAQFDAKSFAALPWQSAALFPALSRHLSEGKGGAPALLPPRADVNGFRELLGLVRDPTVPPSLLVERLREVLDAGERVDRTEHSLCDLPVQARQSRAPPVSLSSVFSEQSLLA